MPNNLRRVRTGLKLTQDDVARAAGVSRQTVCKAENGRKLMPITAQAIADALGCNVDYLFFSNVG